MKTSKLDTNAKEYLPRHIAVEKAGIEMNFINNDESNKDQE